MLKFVLVSLLMFGAVQLSGHADSYKVSKFTYNNDGPYDATFRVRYNLDDGRNCEVFVPGRDFAQQYDPKRVINLMGDKFKIRRGPERCLRKGKIVARAEVWGLVWIAGTRHSCRKSIRLIRGYRGKTVHYKTRGSAGKNNRCRQRIGG